MAPFPSAVPLFPLFVPDVALKALLRQKKTKIASDLRDTGEKQPLFRVFAPLLRKNMVFRPFIALFGWISRKKERKNAVFLCEACSSERCLTSFFVFSAVFLSPGFANFIVSRETLSFSYTFLCFRD